MATITMKPNPPSKFTTRRPIDWDLNDVLTASSQPLLAKGRLFVLTSIILAYQVCDVDPASGIPQVPPATAVTSIEAWKVARVIEARHGHIPERLESLVVGNTLSDEDKTYWYGARGQSGHLDQMKRTMINERIGSGSWFSEYVEGQFHDDLLKRTVTNLDLCARWYEAVPDENASQVELDEKKMERLAMAQEYRNAVTRAQKMRSVTHEKARAEAEKAHATLPMQSQSDKKRTLNALLKAYSDELDTELKPAFGQDHHFSNRREIRMRCSSPIPAAII